MTAPALPARWTALRHHGEQQRLYRSAARFNVVPAGRRSGKTEIVKRRLVRRALGRWHVTHDDVARYFAGAPTRDQAKRIFWEDLKRLSRPYWLKAPSESDLTIYLVSAAELCVVGLDKPERIEGSPWDGGALDEYANMKAKAWPENVRPALSDRGGWCDLIGVPEGRNHYYDLARQAEAEAQAGNPEWGYFHWISADILPAAEVAAARGVLDALTFAQEYEASFVNFHGRAYHAFTDAHKAPLRARYNPRAPLVIALDFNVAPGIAIVCQEMTLPSGIVGTGVIGEVWVEASSTTEIVCRRLLTDWGRHEARVDLFGDASGGAKGSAKVQGSDWDLAAKYLRHGFPGENLPGWKDRVVFNVKDANPPERARVNAVNSRLKAADGAVRCMVDPAHAPYLVKDLEGVTTVKGGSGEIDKKKDPKLTHPSDALGYYIDFRFPVVKHATATGTLAT